MKVHEIKKFKNMLVVQKKLPLPRQTVREHSFLSSRQNSETKIIKILKKKSTNHGGMRLVKKSFSVRAESKTTAKGDKTLPLVISTLNTICHPETQRKVQNEVHTSKAQRTYRSIRQTSSMNKRNEKRYNQSNTVPLCDIVTLVPKQKPRPTRVVHTSQEQKKHNSFRMLESLKPYYKKHEQNIQKQDFEPWAVKQELLQFF